VDQRRVRLRADRRSVLLGIEPDAAEDEPRSRRAVACEDRACDRGLGDSCDRREGLPLAYNKDLQETQEPLYDTVETLEASLAVARGIVASLVFDVARLRAAIDTGHLVATELADYLVTRGVAFREAHDVAGHLVRIASDRGVELASLPLDELRAAHPAFDEDVAGWLDPARAVDRRDVIGGPARTRVISELERVERALSG
jgi:argininosuccinate lyase